MKISLDLDNVLCNFVESWNLWLYETGRTKELLFPEDITSYHWFSSNLGEDCHKFHNENPEDCYARIKPYVGAVDFINYCVKNFEDVEVLSQSSDDAVSSAKLNFCIKHFDFYNVKFCSGKSDKYTQTQGRVLIDDYPVQVIKHVAHNNNHGIVFNQDHRFGWGKLKDYAPFINEVNAAMTLLHVASDYEDVKKQLESMNDRRSL